MESVQVLLARNIRKFRALAGWTRERFSEQVMISPNYLSEIEAGKKFPRPQVLDTICTVLNIHPADLFGDTQNLDEALTVQTFAAQVRDRFPEFLAAILTKSNDSTKFNV